MFLSKKTYLGPFTMSFDSDGTGSSKSENAYVLIWRKKAEEHHPYL